MYYALCEKSDEVLETHAAATIRDPSEENNETKVLDLEIKKKKIKRKSSVSCSSLRLKLKQRLLHMQ